MNKLKALLVFALGVAIAAPAYAETQNVKVSGSIDAYGFYRSDYDLTKNNDAGFTPAGTTVAGGTAAQRSEGDSFFATITQIEVAADLTDNVSTVVNLVNQRDWNADQVNSTTANTTEEFDIALDLAYVQMKEIFYSPLTLTIGRQDMWFGRGFVVGNNSTAWDPEATLLANEYSATTAFDAVRATLDFNPWTVDLAYSKINENAHNAEDDIDLYIANVNYKFAEYNAVAEGYWVHEADRGTSAIASAGPASDSTTHTLGGRVQFDPISQMTLGGELAYQFGDYRPAVAINRDRSAWGVDIFGTYRFDNVWKPEITLEYVLLSGEGSTAASTEEYTGWNSLYRGKFWTAYADFREFLYATTNGLDQPATTNQQFVQVKGSMKPLSDLLLEAAFTYLWNDELVPTSGGEEIGWELDLLATYDYTEDVSFNLLAGWFVPGDFYINPNDDTATDIVSSVKVAF